MLEQIDLHIYNQVHTNTWFLKIDLVWIVGMRVRVCAYVCLCVCVRARGY